MRGALAGDPLRRLTYGNPRHNPFPILAVQRHRFHRLLLVRIDRAELDDFIACGRGGEVFVGDQGAGDRRAVAGVDFLRDLGPHLQRIELAEAGAGGGVAVFPAFLFDQRQEGAGGFDHLCIDRLIARGGEGWRGRGGDEGGAVERQRGEGEQAKGEGHKQSSDDDPGAGLPLRAEARRIPVIARRRAACIPDYRVPQQFGDGFMGGLAALCLQQQARGLAAARYRHLAPRIAQPFVDRVHRKVEAARNRFGIMAADDQPQRLLFLLGQRPEVGGELNAHECKARPVGQPRPPQKICRSALASSFACLWPKRL